MRIDNIRALTEVLFGIHTLHLCDCCKRQSILDPAKVVQLTARLVSPKVLQICTAIEKPIALTCICQSVILSVFWVGMRFRNIGEMNFYASQFQQCCFSLASTVLKYCQNFVTCLQNKLYATLQLGKSNIRERINKTPGMVESALDISQKRVEKQTHWRFSWIDFIKLLGNYHAMS